MKGFEVDILNLIVTVGSSTVFAAGGAYAGIKATLRQNGRDHAEYDKKLEKLESRVDKTEKAIIEMFTLTKTWAERLDKLDFKLKTVCENVEFIKGKLSK